MRAADVASINFWLWTALLMVGINSFFMQLHRYLEGHPTFEQAFWYVGIPLVAVLVNLAILLRSLRSPLGFSAHMSIMLCLIGLPIYLFGYSGGM